MKKGYLIILLGLSLFSNAKSQADFRPGYIITLDNDTLKGFIDFRDDNYNAHNCSFKKELNSKEVHYQPEQIKSYTIIDYKYYQSRKILAKIPLRKAPFWRAL